MPYVRSIFFQYGLEFDTPTNATLMAHSKGGNEIKLRIPREFSNDLFFQYELHFADNEKKLVYQKRLLYLYKYYIIMHCNICK